MNAAARERVVVLGGTGFIGRRLVSALRDPGRVVRVASRHPSAAPSAGVESVRCDLATGEGVNRALEDADIAYFLVHGMAEGAGLTVPVFLFMDAVGAARGWFAIWRYQSALHGTGRAHDRLCDQRADPPRRPGGKDLISPLMAEAVTAMSRHARTFWLAARLLPASVRHDVVLLYLVCRTLDDLVDEGDPSAPHRLKEVAAWAAGGSPVGREELILQYLRERHPAFPLDAVTDFCAGQEQDLGAVAFRTEADLDLYAYRVAGTVGRMMAAVLGTNAPQADGAARALGIALQRTNVLRDVAEDAGRGRSYLPQESFDLASGDRSMQMRIEIAIAQHWYERGLAGVPYLRQGGRVVRGAAQMYRAILFEVERGLGRPEPPTRAVVPARRKLRILAGEMLRLA